MCWNSTFRLRWSNYSKMKSYSNVLQAAYSTKNSIAGADLIVYVTGHSVNNLQRLQVTANELSSVRDLPQSVEFVPATSPLPCREDHLFRLSHCKFSHMLKHHSLLHHQMHNNGLEIERDKNFSYFLWSTISVKRGYPECWNSGKPLGGRVSAPDTARKAHSAPQTL